MKGFTWIKLDPSRADHGAVYGARPGRGMTLLELESGTVAIVGHMSCAGRADAEQHASRMLEDTGPYGGNAEADRRISAATFNTWRAGA